MGGDHHHNEGHHKSNVDQHELKAEMIKELSHYYDHHDLSLLGKVQHFVEHLLEEKHHAKINTSNFDQKKLESFSESKQVSRTVFALKKIKTFNHDFFTSEEEMILEPLPLGILTYGLKYTFAGIDAALLTYFWRNWNFNIRTIGLLGGLVGIQMATLHMPNLVNEVVIQTPRRRALAKKYIQAYGPQFFHDVVNPKYDIEHLRHLQNKLNPY
ncbi:hypothetical protein ABPG74_021411 [Tetrahymena malaccensis]